MEWPPLTKSVAAGEIAVWRQRCCAAIRKAVVIGAQSDDSHRGRRAHGDAWIACGNAGRGKIVIIPGGESRGQRGKLAGRQAVDEHVTRGLGNGSGGPAGCSWFAYSVGPECRGDRVEG